jgi:hypothetical protein
MYPARTLPTGAVRASGGTSGNFALGSLANDLQAAEVEATHNTSLASPGTDPTFAKGAIVAAAIGPGLAPYAAARVGIGERFEGGITYTGRGGRIDARRSFDWDDVSLSIGLGVTADFYGGSVPNVTLTQLHGYGAEVPLLLGWQSAARIYMAWVGVRGGWTHDDVSDLSATNVPAGTVVPSLSADRFYGGTVVGMAAGFRHIHVALELDAAYQVVSGSYNGSSVTIQGISLAPAAALWWTF